VKLRRERLSKGLTSCLVTILSLVLAGPVAALLGMDPAWNPGSPDCARNPQPQLEVHAYDSRTFVIRENLCSTFEAPFLYLLIGYTRAMLIDTGDVADPKAMPLADTVMHMLPGEGPAKLPLLVVHTHRHLDHRAADTQFAQLPNVVIVGFDVESVRRYYKFADWPNGASTIELGDRTVDVIPTPGHNETEVSFYDRSTGLFFSGDFVLPGRLLIEDARSDLASAERVAAFVKGRPVRFVLGGHVEMNTAGNLFPRESTYHPQERSLEMTKEDLLALPAAIRGFNGLYTVRGQFTMENPLRILVLFALLALLLLVVIVWWSIRVVVSSKRLRRAKLAPAASATSEPLA
jgi:hydroxyacylglutathione hydrolase